MSFSDHKITAFQHKITDLPDQPNLQPLELKQYFDSSPEELRQAFNKLCDFLSTPAASACIGFASTAGIPQDNLQDALESLYQMLREAVIGQIPSGSIDGDRLAQDVRDRFSSIESAAVSEQTARQQTDAGLQSQINALNAGKCEAYVGYYIGDGTQNRIIPLGKTPKTVIVMSNMGKMYLSDENGTYGGIATVDSPVLYSNEKAVEIVTNGFRVTFGGPYYCLRTNLNETVYNYIALV